MAAFVYDGSVPGHAVWSVVGKVFIAGIHTEVTDDEARKLRCLPFFCEVTAKDIKKCIVSATDIDGPASVVESPENTQTKKRGRPPGAKNKPKVNDGNENSG
jgi:hypothetical protein